MTRVAIAGVAALGVLIGAGTARAEPVAVIVVPAQEVWAQAGRGAAGLIVPGAGASVTREQALQSLTTGRSISGLAGKEDREPLIEIATRPAALTIYVALPPPGRQHNVTRYPVAIVGGGFRGILHSPSTRLPGSSRSPTSRRRPSTWSRAENRCSTSGREARPRCASSTGSSPEHTTRGPQQQSGSLCC